jgi:hypothetical protein
LTRFKEFFPDACGFIVWEGFGKKHIKTAQQLTGFGSVRAMLFQSSRKIVGNAYISFARTLQDIMKAQLISLKTSELHMSYTKRFQAQKNGLS